MRVLLDECLPRKLKQEFHGHTVFTVPEMGWAGKQNGELLRLAKDKFDVFVTLDRNLSFQQNLRVADLAVVILEAENSRLATLKPLIPKVLRSLQTIKPKEILTVRADA